MFLYINNYYIDRILPLTHPRSSFSAGPSSSSIVLDRDVTALTTFLTPDRSTGVDGGRPEAVRSTIGTFIARCSHRKLLTVGVWLFTRMMTTGTTSMGGTAGLAASSRACPSDVPPADNRRDRR